MSSENNSRQAKIDEYFQVKKSNKSEASLLPKIETSLGINEISSNTLASLLKGEANLNKFVIIDCRFDYEFEGGHILNAVNLTHQENLLEFLEGQDWLNSPIIFHCEFSELRGPTMIKQLRNYDRTMNIENYPNLTYPEIYLLKGGYAEFFGLFPELCEPSNYVKCKTKKVKRALTQIQKMNRLL